MAPRASVRNNLRVIPELGRISIQWLFSSFSAGLALAFMNSLKLCNFSLTYVFNFLFIIPKIKLIYAPLLYQ